VKVLLSTHLQAKKLIEFSYSNKCICLKFIKKIPKVYTQGIKHTAVKAYLTSINFSGFCFASSRLGIEMRNSPFL